MFIHRIDEIFRDDPASHLQASDVAIELTTHLWTIKTTGCSQFASDQRTLLLQGKQDGLIDGTLWRCRMQMATVVAEVWPPLTTHRSSRFMGTSGLAHCTCPYVKV